MFLLQNIPCYISILGIKIGTFSEIWSNFWPNCTRGSVKIVLRTIQKAKLIENQVKNYFQFFSIGQLCMQCLSLKKNLENTNCLCFY